MEKRRKVKCYFSPGLKYFLTLLPSSGIILAINARTTGSKIEIGEQVGHLSIRICNFYILHDWMRNPMLAPR